MESLKVSNAPERCISYLPYKKLVVILAYRGINNKLHK